MKITYSVWVAAAFVLFQSFGAHAFSSAKKARSVGGDLGIAMSLDVRRLPNGLNVIFVPDASVPIISYQTWYRVGSVDEEPGITGISHLFEHLMFKGTPRYGAKQFFEQLEAKGAEVNAFTTRDYTVYYENFVPALLDKVIDMESDRMANLILTDEVLQVERQVVLEERKLRTDNSPAGKMQEALWMLAYRYHPYQWPVIGYPGDLLALTTARIREYYRKHYQPGNATVVITGAVNPDLAFEKIKEHYGKIQARPRPERTVRSEPEQREERRLILREPVASEQFAMGYHISAANNDDSYALDVLANILFEGTESRAHRLLVEDKNVALSVSGVAFTPSYPGLFMVSGMLKVGQTTAAAEQLLEQLFREIREKPVTQPEIDKAVRQLTVQLVDSVRTPFGLGQLVGIVQTIFDDPYRFADDLAKYTKVTREDVSRVASKYLFPNNRSVIVMVPGAAGGKE